MITEKLMALTWKEPFATLMLAGKQETRTWPTKYRGLVLICAAQKGYSLKEEIDIMGDQRERAIDEFVKINTDPFWAFGKAIAIGRLVDCRQMKKEDEPICFVKYNPHLKYVGEKAHGLKTTSVYEHIPLYVHVYENVRAIEPFNWKGSQGWREVSEEVKLKIKFI